MTDLPVDITSRYPTRSPGDLEHKQLHDALQAFHNRLVGSGDVDQDLVDKITAASAPTGIGDMVWIAKYDTRAIPGPEDFYVDGYDDDYVAVPAPMWPNGPGTSLDVDMATGIVSILAAGSYRAYAYVEILNIAPDAPGPSYFDAILLATQGINAQYAEDLEFAPEVNTGLDLTPGATFWLPAGAAIRLQVRSSTAGDADLTYAELQVQRVG